MTYLKIFSTAIVSMILLVGCNDDDDPVPAPQEPTTIVDVAVANGSFTTLVAALQATGLDTTLADTSAKYTVFAPTDDAFALLGQETIDALLADTETLADILTYHVISGEVEASAAITLAGTKVAMASGDFVGLSLSGDSLLVNTATVTMTDIMTDNGIIHVLDAVLLPPEESMQPSENIVETAVAAGDFTTLVAALQATGLDAVLADEALTYTVFAPTDAAFALIGEQTLNTLLANPEVLSDILLQHVVAETTVDSVSAYSLNGAMVETASMASIPLTINSETDRLVFGGANIITKDIYTSNGVIHVIDAVIVADVEIPPEPMNLVEVAVSNGSFTTLVSALQSTGLDAVLSNSDNNYTVFAPTDAAFEKLPEGTLESLTTEQLTDILLYHVLPSKVMADGAISLAQMENNQTTTANGSNIALSFTATMLFANGAKISMADIMATNGVIHVVDTVILPPSVVEMSEQSIVDVALADPDNFSTLVSALSAADLVTTLADEESTFTVFAPTNAAFDKIDSDALTALLADVDTLTNVLLSHVLSDVEVSSLDAFSANGKTVNSASNKALPISIDADTGSLMVAGANVVITDIQTSNGIIHVIDTVILD